MYAALIVELRRIEPEERGEARPLLPPRGQRHTNANGEAVGALGHHGFVNGVGDLGPVVGAVRKLRRLLRSDINEKDSGGVLRD